VPSHIQTLAITATLDEGTFGQFRAASLSLIDSALGKQVLSYSFAENLSEETAIVLAEIYRHKDEWRINAIGRGFKGGLAALCDNYGIEIEKG
jgi:tellurium resistance protein TerD